MRHGPISVGRSRGGGRKVNVGPVAEEKDGAAQDRPDEGGVEYGDEAVNQAAGSRGELRALELCWGREQHQGRAATYADVHRGVGSSNGRQTDPPT